MHTAKAAADGLLAAYLTADGLSGARRILEGEQGMAAGMSSDDPERLVDRLGSRWALLETSFKFHASCRHTHPAADALLALMQREGARSLADRRGHRAGPPGRHRRALGRVVEPQTVHQAKFSMGTVLGLIAVYGKAGLGEFHRHALSDPRVAAFRGAGRDAPGPGGRRRLSAALARAGRSTRSPGAAPYRHRRTKGDPGNTLSRDELADKFRRLLAFSGAATDAEAEILIQRAWGCARRLP